VSARHSLLFARLLRAIIRRTTSEERAEDLLNVVDKRTLVGLLKLGDTTTDASTTIPSDVGQFLGRQRWILDAVALREVERELRARAECAARTPNAAPSGVIAARVPTH
jgi:hypothetical protein